MGFEPSAVAANRRAGPSSGLSPTGALEVAELEALFEAYGAFCYGLALNILRDADLAHDVVQQVFLDHWRDAALGATGPTHRRWLLVLTHRKAVDRVRREQRRSCSPLDAALEHASTPPRSDDLAMAGVQAPKARAALASLSQVQRQALALAYWGGCTQREVAEITRAPLATVKTRMLHGMTALREAFGEEGA